jgi:hypothetical protein
VVTPDFSRMTPSQLLQLHSAVLDEMRRREIIRSRNNPTGDYAEWLVATACDLCRFQCGFREARRREVGGSQGKHRRRPPCITCGPLPALLEIWQTRRRNAETPL